MKNNGRKIRSKSMKIRRKARRKLLKINRECKNYINEKKIEKKLRMKFLTNFSVDEQRIHSTAAYRSRLEYQIVDKAYYKNGDGVITGMKAIYVRVDDKKKLWKFWSIISDHANSYLGRRIDLYTEIKNTPQIVHSLTRGKGDEN